MATLKHAGYSVVIATHPETPNYSRNARGRVLHLAKSSVRDTLTLCNMLVSFPETGLMRKFEDKPCALCQKILSEGVKKKVADAKRYSFTINTDASFNQGFGGVAGYAFWIKSEHYKLTKAGPIRPTPANNSIAELIAIEYALWTLDHFIDETAFLRRKREENGIRIYVNTDSQWAINALEGTIGKSKHLEVIKRVAAIPRYYEIVCKHIKSHQKKDGPDFGTARQWVNDWCDREAKNAVREEIQRIRHAKV